MGGKYDGFFDPDKYKKIEPSFQQFNTSSLSSKEMKGIIKKQILDGIIEVDSKQKKKITKVKTIIHKKLVVEVTSKGKKYHFYDMNSGWKEISGEGFFDEMEENSYRLTMETNEYTVYSLDIEN